MDKYIYVVLRDNDVMCAFTNLINAKKLVILFDSLPFKGGASKYFIRKVKLYDFNLVSHIESSSKFKDLIKDKL